MGLLRNRNFVFVFAGHVATLFGGSVQRLALSLFLLEMTGSPGTYSLVTAASIVPYVVLAPFAGLVADAFDRRRVMAVLDGASSCLLASFGAALLFGVESVGLVAFAMVALSSLAAFHSPAVTSCLPQIVGRRDLAAANGAISQVSAWSGILGPMVAGVVFGFVGVGPIVVAQAACYAFSAVMACMVKIPDAGSSAAGPGFAIYATPAWAGTAESASPAGSGGRQRTLADAVRAPFSNMRRMLATLRGSYPTTLGILASYGMFNVFVIPINSIVVPSALMLDLGVSSEAYGAVQGVVSVGMLASGLMVALRPRWFPFRTSYRWNFMMPALLATMGTTLAVCSHPSLAAGIVAACGMGTMFAIGVGNIVTLTYNQMTVPVAMLGSLSALSTAFASCSSPVGQVVFGQLLEIGIPAGALVLGAAAVCLAVCAFTRWNIRRAG